MSLPDTVRLMTVQEVARRLNISRSKAYQLVDTGAISHFRIGGSVRVAEEQLAEFLESVRRGPPERAAPAKRIRTTLKHLRA